ncbi:hypothetical protein [Hymenobacter tenuis]
MLPLPTVQAKANEAIARCLGLGLDEQRSELIKQEYGFATFCFVQEAYTFAVNYLIDWSEWTLDEALPHVTQGLRARYPFLTEASIRRLSNCFAYVWK